MLYDPGAFEPLTDEPWDEARVRDGIATIVADADAAFDPEGLWPAHEWDAWEAVLPLKNLYVGAAGVVFALDELRGRGFAETSLDLSAIAATSLERWRAEPDVTGDLPEPRESALLTGETGILLVACRLGHRLEDDLQARVRANLANEADDLMFGTPGTLVAAIAMGWDELARESADTLASRRDEDGLWTQRIWGMSFQGVGTVHGLAGNVRALLRVEDPRNEALRSESAAVLARVATREDGLANWHGEGKLQWCAGAPGVVSAARDYLDEELLLGGAELVWRAGPPAARRDTASATAPPATASPCSPRSRGRRTRSGSSALAASPSTHSGRQRACRGVTRSSPAGQGRPSSPPHASTAMRGTQCSRCSRRARARARQDRRACRAPAARARSAGRAAGGAAGRRRPASRACARRAEQTSTTELYA